MIIKEVVSVCVPTWSQLQLDSYPLRTEYDLYSTSPFSFSLSHSSVPASVLGLTLTRPSLSPHRAMIVSALEGQSIIGLRLGPRSKHLDAGQISDALIARHSSPSAGPSHRGEGGQKPTRPTTTAVLTRCQSPPSPPQGLWQTCRRPFFSS